MNAYYNEISSAVLKIVFSLIGLAFSVIIIPWVKNSAIPWMKEKQLYSLVTKFVHAAEKLAETGAIDRATKKEYVINLLKNKGYNITADAEAFIESAVKELDMTIQFGVGEIIDAFDDEAANSEGSDKSGSSECE